MKNVILILVSAILSMSFAGCIVNQPDDREIKESPKGNISNTKQYKDISPTDAKKRLDKEEEIVLLDVRTVEEYAEKHIPGSVLIPLDVIEQEAQLKLKDKNAPIFVYCRSGRRSITASEILIEQGYTNVFNLGGIIDWPYETQTGIPQ